MCFQSPLPTHQLTEFLLQPTPTLIASSPVKSKLYIILNDNFMVILSRGSGGTKSETRKKEMMESKLQ